MKKDRNCMGTPYPIYGAVGPMPMMPGANVMAAPTMMTNPNMNNEGSEYMKLQNQINDLNNRVSRLEGMVDISNKPAYNESNFYMV